MVEDKQIPLGVVAVFDAVWEMTRCTDKAIAAALNAWPEMECRPTFGPSRIILPLPQEVSDE